MVKEISKLHLLNNYVTNHTQKIASHPHHPGQMRSAIVSASQSSKGFCSTILHLLTLPVRKLLQLIKWIFCCGKTQTDSPNGQKKTLSPQETQEFLETRKRILTLVQENGLNLQHVAEAFQNDDEIVMEAIKQNGLALQFAHKRLQANGSFVLEAVRQNGLALQFADIMCRKDFAIVHNAIHNNPEALAFASK